MGMRRSFRERLAIYLMGGMFLFSGLFVGLWIFTPEFAATGGTLAGIVLAQFALALVGVVGRDLAERALSNRENGNGKEAE
jgi:uncharacterized membrane protein YiaA